MNTHLINVPTYLMQKILVKNLSNCIQQKLLTVIGSGNKSSICISIDDDIYLPLSNNCWARRIKPDPCNNRNPHPS